MGSTTGETDSCCYSESSIGEEGVEESILYAKSLEQVKRFLFLDTEEVRTFSPETQSRISHIEDELYMLRRRRSDIHRKETELLYLLQDTLLQEDCSRLRQEMTRLNEEYQQDTEPELRSKEIEDSIVNIVNRRDSMLTNFHSERKKSESEEKELEDEYKRNKMMWRKIIKSDAYYDTSTGNIKFSLRNSMKNIQEKCCFCSIL